MMKVLWGILLIVSAGACDDGGMVDQTIQRGVRQSAVQACVAWVPESQITAAAGLNADRLCACAADRLLEGKGVADLGELRPDSPENRAAIVQCVAQIQSGAGRSEESW